jgi:hypothetical protein
MMMIPRRSCVVLALLLAACGGSEEPADASQAADSAQPAQPATVAQVGDTAPPPPAAATPAAPATPAEAQDTMLTPWRALDFPSEPWEQSAATAEALLQRVRDVVAAQLEEPDASVLPTRMESQSADSAVGILVHPDQADDSVRDVEFRLHMRREGSAWRVTGVDRRERCRRGVADGGLCA